MVEAIACNAGNETDGTSTGPLTGKIRRILLRQHALSPLCPVPRWYPRSNCKLLRYAFSRLAAESCLFLTTYPPSAPSSPSSWAAPCLHHFPDLGKISSMYLIFRQSHVALETGWKPVPGLLLHSSNPRAIRCEQIAAGRSVLFRLFPSLSASLALSEAEVDNEERRVRRARGVSYLGSLCRRLAKSIKSFIRLKYQASPFSWSRF